MKKTNLKIRAATCLILYTVSGMTGITALFLPFTEEVSPVIAVSEIYPLDDWGIWRYLLLAFPFFLSVFVSAAFVRWMISGLLSRPERAIVYMISSMMALLILYIVIDLFLNFFWEASSEINFWLTLVIPLLPLLFGAYVVIKNFRNKAHREISAVMAMQIVYLSNALFCLILWINTWQIGAYFVVVTAGVYLTQIVMATVKLGVFQRGGKSGSV